MKEKYVIEMDLAPRLIAPLEGLDCGNMILRLEIDLAGMQFLTGGGKGEDFMNLFLAKMVLHCAGEFNQSNIDEVLTDLENNEQTMYNSTTGKYETILTK